MSRADGRARGAGPSRKRRLLPVAVALLGALPWTVQLWTGGVGLVFAFGLVNPETARLVTLPEYLGLSGGPAGLPDRLLAWPVAVLLWGLAALSALGGRLLDREDRRVTGWLLVLAGASHLAFALGLNRPGLLAIPLGTVLLWAVAWWGYGGALVQVAGR